MLISVYNYFVIYLIINMFIGQRNSRRKHKWMCPDETDLWTNAFNDVNKDNCSIAESNSGGDFA